MGRPKRVVLVLGPEGSGSKMVLQIISKKECKAFEWGSAIPKYHRVVEHTSYPAGWKKRWHSLELEVGRVRSEGYEPVAVVCVRDWFCMNRSATDSHKRTWEEQVAHNQMAYPFIFSELKKLEVPFLTVTYESFLLHPIQAQDKLYEMLNIPGLGGWPHVKVYNMNSKYYPDPEEEALEYKPEDHKDRKALV